MPFASIAWTLIAVLGALIVLLGWALWSLTHIRPGRWETLERTQQPGARHGALSAGLCLTELVAGNRVRLLSNGQGFWPEVQAAIKQAQQSVHFETYLWETGSLSASLVAALCARAQAGVAVRMVIDAVGGMDMSEQERRRLRDSGVELGFFRPPSWRNVGTYNGRDHRKMVIVDSQVAFVGGHCVTDNWLGDAEDLAHYRDLSVQLEGPLVRQVQAAFAENWNEVSGALLADEQLFPDLPVLGTCRGHLAYISFERRASTVKTLHMLAICSAQHSITIQNPYFLPDKSAQEALAKAVARGVRVRVMTPTLEAIDSTLVVRAMRHQLADLLRTGVEVYGYEQTLLHQKVLVIDGYWSIIGSTNFDFRSFEINEEMSLSLFEPSLAEELAATFEADLSACRRYTSAELAHRSWLDKVLDCGAFALRKQL